VSRTRAGPTVSPASRREQSAVLFSELGAVLARIRETEAAATLDQDLPGATDMPGLLASLQALRGVCAARAHLYQQAAGLLGRQEALWAPGGHEETRG